MSQSQPEPPTWAKSATRLDEGIWEPPTSTESRKRWVEPLGVSQTVNRLFSRFETWDRDALPTDLDWGPNDPKLDDDAPLDDPMPDMVNLETEEAKIDVDPSSEIFQGLLRLNYNLEKLNPIDITKDRFWSACIPFVHDMDRLFEEQLVTASDIKILLQPFDSTIQREFDFDLLEDARRRLIVRILKQMSRPELHKGLRIAPFKAFFRHFETMDKNDYATWHIFSKFVHALPITRKPIITRSIAVTIVASYLEFQASMPFPGPKVAYGHDLVWRCLSKLSINNYATFWDDVIELVRQRNKNADVEKFRRITATLMAFDITRTSSECFQMYGQAWFQPDAHLFVLGRVLATEKLPDDIRYRLATAAYESGPMWSRLAAIAFVPDEEIRSAVFRELYLATKATGHFDLMVEQLLDVSTAERLTLRSRLCLTSLAIECRDYKEAYRIWKLARSKSNFCQVATTWRWPSWTPYVEQMIKDPKIGVKGVWKVIPWGRQFSDAPTPVYAKEVYETRQALLEDMGEWVLEAHFLSERTTLRELEYCLLTYKKMNRGRLSPRMILCLVRAILRDLEAGRPGRRERLAWMVTLVRDQLGDEEADRVVMLINGWRWTINNRMSQDKNKTAKELEDEQRESALLNQRDEDEEALAAAAAAAAVPEAKAAEGSG